MIEGLTELSVKARDTIAALLDAEDARVRLRAAELVLAYAIGKPVPAPEPTAVPHVAQCLIATFESDYNKAGRANGIEPTSKA